MFQAPTKEFNNKQTAKENVQSIERCQDMTDTDLHLLYEKHYGEIQNKY